MVSTAAQLSLFDLRAAEVGSFYKPGDWVKIKKVPAIAKHVKCGQVYHITSVEKASGRLEFWNPFANQSDFLYPSEVKLALTPADQVDSVSTNNAQTADTEYTVQVAGDDDSVSKSNVQIADTEYTVPPADNDDSVSKAISTYTPRGTARSGEYFRFSYRDGARMRHIHIRGGNTDSPIAQAKVAEVRSLLAAGISPAEIAAMLKTPI
jgi:hypothetical protein